jgi:hypothetical protein
VKDVDEKEAILKSLRNITVDTKEQCIALLNNFSISPSNRTVLYNNGFHSSVFNLLVKEDVASKSKLPGSQALCNMTCEESANLKNNILNNESFGKLKKLMDKIICSSSESIANRQIAQKNAVIIENIFLIISNMLVGNEQALTPIINSGFTSHILNHLSPDDDDTNRQNAGNIENQQKAALHALHSITFHQTDHIDMLMTNNILACIKIMMNKNNKNLIEQAISGVLYNISVKGSAGSSLRKREVQKNDYLKEFEEEEGLMEIINNGAKTGPTASSTSLSSYSTTTQLYALLMIGQLYRNARLKQQYKHIISKLKKILTNNSYDEDIKFKARNALEMLAENASMCKYFIIILL